MTIPLRQEVVGAASRGLLLLLTAVGVVLLLVWSPLRHAGAAKTSDDAGNPSSMEPPQRAAPRPRRASETGAVTTT